MFNFTNEQKSYFYGFFTVLIWGSFIAISKINLKDLDSFQVLFYTSFIASLITFLILIYQKKISHLKVISLSQIFKLSLISLPAFLYYLFYYIALKIIPVTEAAALNYLWPLAVVFFAVVLFKEKVTKTKIIAILLGIIGCSIVITRGNIFQYKFTNLLGDLITITAALSWGLFSNLGKKNKFDQTISYFVFFLTIFLFSIPSMLLFSTFQIPRLNNVWGLLWIGILNLSISYHLWFKALKLGDIAKLSNLMYFTPFVALVWIAIMLKENILPIQLFGLLFILFGSLVYILGEEILN